MEDRGHRMGVHRRRGDQAVVVAVFAATEAVAVAVLALRRVGQREQAPERDAMPQVDDHAPAQPRPRRGEAATGGREQIAAGGAWRTLLPEPVADYIADQGLYGAERA